MRERKDKTEYNRAYYLANREKLLEMQKTYYERYKKDPGYMTRARERARLSGLRRKGKKVAK